MAGRERIVAHRDRRRRPRATHGRKRRDGRLEPLLRVGVSSPARRASAPVSIPALLAFRRSRRTRRARQRPALLLAQPVQSFQPVRPRPRRRKRREPARAGRGAARRKRDRPGGRSRSGSSACPARSATTSIRSASISASRREGGLAALIYEVHNTFGERHSYVLPARSAADVVRHELRQDVLRLAVPAAWACATSSRSRRRKNDHARDPRARPGRSGFARGAGGANGAT